MDALTVMNTMSETWMNLLEKYYDTISDAHVNHLSEKFSLDKEELTLSVSELKASILNGAKSTFINANSTLPETKTSKPKTAKKPSSTANCDNGKYSNMNRNEIVELCKSLNIPVRRKTQDMIDALLKNDASNEAGPSSSAHVDNDSSKKEKKPVKKETKKPKKEKKTTEQVPELPPPVVEDSDCEPEFNNDISSELEEED